MAFKEVIYIWDKIRGYPSPSPYQHRIDFLLFHLHMIQSGVRTQQVCTCCAHDVHMVKKEKEGKLYFCEILT